jgi:hypothetical protein
VLQPVSDAQLLVTPQTRVFLEKLTVLQLVKKFPAFYGTRTLITVLTTVSHMSLSQANPIHALTVYFFNIHLNIILPSTPRSSKWTPFLRIFPPKPVCTSYVPFAPHISFSFILFDE